ncbi:MAG TPA: hypothetical protein VJ246_02795 [Patescibacteria group bacterium]|nr:hypothetical protein [Patescibacteria group bacterium]
MKKTIGLTVSFFVCVALFLSVVLLFDKQTVTGVKAAVDDGCGYECKDVEWSAERYVYEEDSEEKVYGSWDNWSSWSENNKCSSQDENDGKCEDESRGLGWDREYRRRYRSVTVNHICPAGYEYHEQNGPNDCRKLETFGPITINYEKWDLDPTKCHRETAESLNIPQWAISDFNTENPEFKFGEKFVPEGKYLGEDNMCHDKEPVCVVENEQTQYQDDEQCTCEDLDNCEPDPVCEWNPELSPEDELCQEPKEPEEPSPSPTIEPSPTPTDEPESSPTPSPTNEPEPSPSPSPSPSPESSSTPTPSPTPTPTPTPSPSNGPGKQSKLSNDNLQCSSSDFEVIMDLLDNGNGVKDVEVTFTFNGSEKRAKTNDSGRARTSFGRAAGVVSAKADGFDSQTMTIDLPQCPVSGGTGGGQVLGATTGKVLGASTLAATGSAVDALAQVGLAFGFVLTIISGYGYYRVAKETSKN